MQDRLVQGDACCGKGGSGRGVGVNHSPDLRVFLIDAQVQLGFGGGLPVAFQHLSLHVQLYQHFLPQGPLGYPRRGHPQGVAAHPEAEVAVVGSHQPPLVEPQGGREDFLPGLVVADVVAHREASFQRGPKSWAKLSAKGG